MSATPAPHPSFLARLPTLSYDELDWLLRRHERMQQHHRATPNSIARHAASIAAILAEIARRRTGPSPLWALPSTYHAPAQREMPELVLAVLRESIARTRRASFHVVT